MDIARLGQDLSNMAMRPGQYLANIEFDRQQRETERQRLLALEQRTGLGSLAGMASGVASGAYRSYQKGQRQADLHQAESQRQAFGQGPAGLQQYMHSVRQNYGPSVANEVAWRSYLPQDIKQAVDDSEPPQWAYEMAQYTRRLMPLFE